MGADGTDKNKKKIRKFGKKKVFLVAALVAVFVGALGVTAVGRRIIFLGDGKGTSMTLFLIMIKTRWR